jgi:hypothetical protein
MLKSTCQLEVMPAVIITPDFTSHPVAVSSHIAFLDA